MPNRVPKKILADFFLLNSKFLFFTIRARMGPDQKVRSLCVISSEAGLGDSLPMLNEWRDGRSRLSVLYVAQKYHGMSYIFVDNFGIESRCI